MDNMYVLTFCWVRILQELQIFVYIVLRFLLYYYIFEVPYLYLSWSLYCLNKKHYLILITIYVVVNVTWHDVVCKFVNTQRTDAFRSLTLIICSLITVPTGTIVKIMKFRIFCKNPRIKIYLIYLCRL
jgi:hypothetical protein